MQYIFLMKISSIFYQPTITQRILKIFDAHAPINQFDYELWKEFLWYDHTENTLEFAVATEVYDSQIWNNRVCQQQADMDSWA